MKISYNWLKKHLPTAPSPDKVATMLTQLGLEVTKLTPFHLVPPQLIIGHVLTCTPHPQADKLKKTTIDIGTDTPLNIICGAPNIATGQKIILAPIGTTLPLSNNKHLKIKKTKIRGEISEGMICSQQELGLATTQQGILTIDTKYKPGTSASQYLSAPADTILDIELTPNRADALSHIGIARELAALTQEDLETPLLRPLISTDIRSLKITVEQPTTCPRYVAAVINVQLQPSPIWLQKRLKAINITPINNVVDITNFVMHELGQPLHAFDYDKLPSKKLIIKKLPKNTPFTALDNITRQLTGDELMICDKTGPLAMAGIIGGHHTKITPSTKTILLESAYFEPTTIAKAARHHRLHTEAAFRFERGTDPELPRTALQRAINLLQDIAHATLTSDIIEHYPHHIQPIHIPINYDYIHKTIGFTLAPKLIHNLLQRLDIIIQDITQQGFTAIVPPYRVDVTRPADLIEEILRLYGYNNLPQHTQTPQPYRMPTLQHEKHLIATQRITNLLTAQGYLQIITNPITKPQHTQADSTTKKALHLANPLNNQLSTLRQTLLHSGLQVISHNLNHGLSNLKLFELGKTYDREQETQKLALWLVGNKEEPNWITKPTPLTLQDLYATIHLLLQHHGIQDWHTLPLKNNLYQNALTLYTQQQPLLHMGLPHPDLLKQMNINTQVLFAQIDLKTLLKYRNEQQYYKPISKYPTIKRDISIAVNPTITFEHIRHLIQQQKLPQLQTLSLIDFYQGNTLQADQASYTLRLILQDTKKTLKDKHANKIVEQLAQVLNEKLGATIR